MAIKDLIKAGRERLKMTEQRFADACGVSRSAIQQWENGNTAPKRAHQQRVADLIGITVGELMSGQSEKYPQPGTTKLSAHQNITPYPASLLDEARRLMEALNQDGQREALNYMRFLSQRYPAEKSGTNGPSDTVSDTPKAA